MAKQRRYAQISSFDEQLEPELNSEAIDFRAASELFKPTRKLSRRDLQTRKIITSYQGSLCRPYRTHVRPSLYLDNILGNDV